jgi:hypothetical protein
MTFMTRAKRLDELVSSVEDLLGQLPENLTPDIAALRDRVDAGIFEAWTSIAGEGAKAHRTEVRHNARLWATVGLALVLAGTTLACRILRPSDSRLT